MATTDVETLSMSALPAAHRSCNSLPPDYDDGKSVELGTPSHTTRSTDSLPKYHSVVTTGSSLSGSTFSASIFYATHNFQIETVGHPLFAFPLPTKPDPIPVYTVSPTGQVGALAYQSNRPARSSGNCVLVRAGSDQPICTTTYRFGPNRPPRIHLQSDGHDEEFDVTSNGCTTRTQTIRTHLGTFQWRYASRSERKAAGGADSLLVMDQVHTVALVGGSKTEERRKRVAQLVRKDGLRSEGSSKRTAGNGGRLVMDLRELVGEKSEAAQLEAFVVASCLVMLKKEVDRRRMHQAIAMMGGAGS